MALISGLLAVVGRFAGRILNSSLGWATLLLFGKVSGRRQTLVLLIALGALVWVIVLIGVLVPAVAVFLLAAIPLPPFVDERWVRIAMGVAAAIIPLLIGVAALVVADRDHRPKGVRGLVVGVLRGYPFTLLLAVTVGFLAGVSIVRKVTSLARRREDAHIPLIVKPGGYDRVLADVSSVLEAADLPVRAVPAPAVLSIPPRLLDAIAGPSLGALVPDRLMLLRAPDLEVLVYPSDLAINGTRSTVSRARAAIAAKLTESPAYLTTTAEAERVEDDIRKLALDMQPSETTPVSPERLQTRLAELDGKLAGLAIDFDEWETLYRERLQVERNLLTHRAESGDEAGVGPTRMPGEVVHGLAAVGLIIDDVVQMIWNRVAPPRVGGRR
jgi:hypothetical protein